MRRWFDVLLKKAKQSYNQLIVVKDMDQLGRDKLFVDVLCQHFAVTIYEERYLYVNSYASIPTSKS